METISIPGAEIHYEKDFLSSQEATTLFNALPTKCAWERRRSSFNYPVPRDEAYYGDPETNTDIHGASTNRSPGFRNCSP